METVFNGLKEGESLIRRRESLLGVLTDGRATLYGAIRSLPISSPDRRPPLRPAAALCPPADPGSLPPLTRGVARCLLRIEMAYCNVNVCTEVLAMPE